MIDATGAMVEAIVRGQQGKEVEYLQRLLARAGHRMVADGVFGPRTQAAVAAFQRERGRMVTGAQVDAALLEELERVVGRSGSMTTLSVEPSRAMGSSWSMPMLVTEDRSGGIDCLGVNAEARAFARLVCSRRTMAPLSVGLFGDWGSGKSFFMEQLQGEIESRCAAFTRVCTKLQTQGDEAGLMAMQQRWHGRVAQITFNAWHYAEPNLWASLVTRVFDELASIISPAEPVEATRARLLAEVSEGKQRREQAKLDLRQAEVQLAGARVERERREAELAKVREELAVVEAVGPMAGGETADDAPPRLGVRGPWKALQVTLRWVWSRGRWSRVALVGGVALVVLGIVLGLALWRGWWAEWLEPWIAIATTVSGVFSGAVGTIGAWWLVIQPKIDDARSAHASYLSHKAIAGDIIDRAVRDMTRGSETALGTAHQRMEEATVGLDSATMAAEQATENVARARRMMQELEAGHRFHAFIRDRDEGDDYRRHLGLVSLIRDDVTRLEQILDQVEREGPPDGEIAPLSRVVLYIDDLDRCEPARVVEVLQALHLLLATPIFVVVVAADVRWLRRSLALYYERLLPRSTAGTNTDGLDPTPRSYLEKVFQIPFSLRPIDADGFAALVSQVVQPRVSFATLRTTTEQLAEVRRAAADESVDAAAAPAPASAAPKPEPSSATPLVDVQARRMQEEIDADLQQDLALTLDRAEIELLQRLHVVVGTPRLAKALVNTYRLLRAELEASLLPTYVADGTCRGVLTLLAIQIGRPSEAIRLFDALHRTERATLGEVLHELAEQAGSDRREARWQSLAIAVREVGTAAASVTVLQPWTARIRRFSFEPWPTKP